MLNLVTSLRFNSVLTNGYSHKDIKMNEPVADFYAGKSVFITGGTGFLGKVLIEKLLRTCVGIDNIYILIRDKDGVDTRNRIQVITDSELFKTIKIMKPETLKKIVPIIGDVTLPHLGIKPEDEAELREKVSVVFHSAATVKFNEPLHTAMKINVEGTRSVLDLCHRLKKIDVFVHISTAYSNCNLRVINEVVYPPPMTFEKALKLCQENLSFKELKPYLNGLPNTYTFTKAIAENYVIENHGNIPIVILRPSTVTAIAKEPLPGWLENWQIQTRIPYNCAEGYARVFHCDKNNVLDIVPVDYVTNLTIVVASRCSQKKGVAVYHSCSSSTNPIRLKDYFMTFVNSISNITHQKNNKVLFIKPKFLFKIVYFFVQTTPAYVADFWLLITGRSPKHVKNEARAELLRGSAEYFLLISPLFDSRNTTALHDSLSPKDRSLFPFHTADIEWKSYIELCAQGVKKYLMWRNKDQK